MATNIAAARCSRPLGISQHQHISNSHQRRGFCLPMTAHFPVHRVARKSHSQFLGPIMAKIDNCRLKVHSFDQKVHGGPYIGSPESCISGPRRSIGGRRLQEGRLLGVNTVSISRRCQPPMGLFGLGSEAPPESIPLTPLKSEEDLDAALKTAEEEGKALLIDWMATWCRKCIYLLPKMEKLSAEFQDVKFYMVNVNEVPGALVKRGGIQKMPTIQLWKNNERVGEVIGGHKAWMVMDEIREMIKNDGVQGASSS